MSPMWRCVGESRGRPAPAPAPALRTCSPGGSGRAGPVMAAGQVGAREQPGLWSSSGLRPRPSPGQGSQASNYNVEELELRREMSGEISTLIMATQCRTEQAPPACCLHQTEFNLRTQVLTSTVSHSQHQPGPGPSSISSLMQGPSLGCTLLTNN